MYIFSTLILFVWINPPLVWSRMPLTKGRLPISKLQLTLASDHSHHSFSWFKTLLGLQTSFYSKASPFVLALA